MTAQDLGNLRVAELVQEGADLPEYLKLLRDVGRAEECGEAESMAVETQDAADAEGGPTEQDMRTARKALDQLYADQYTEQTGLPAFDRAALTSSLAAGEGPAVTHPAPPEGFPFDRICCYEHCPAYRLLEEHSRGDRDGRGLLRGLAAIFLLILPAIYGWVMFIATLLRP